MCLPVPVSSAFRDISTGSSVTGRFENYPNTESKGGERVSNGRILLRYLQVSQLCFARAKRTKVPMPLR